MDTVMSTETEYRVHWAEFGILEDQEYKDYWNNLGADIDPFAAFGGSPIPKPSNQIDDRTYRVSSAFDTLETAMDFAKKKLAENDLQWLAMLEIKKVIVETVEKLK